MAVLVLCGAGTVAQRTEATASQTSQDTLVTVRWGARPGVTRYRLQLANDRDFADIVVDRVVYGHEYQVNELLPGRYFWRIASLDGRLGEFSSPGVIEIAQNAAPTSRPIVPPTRERTSAGAFTVVTRSGWYAAFTEVSRPMPAHLRSRDAMDIVATTNEGRVVALDGLNGVALWIRQLNSKTASPLTIAIRDGSGLENVLVISATDLTLLDGKSGKDIWHDTLPGVVSTAVADGDKVFAVDNSLERAFLINASTAKLIAEVRLPARVVGAPLFMNALGASSVVVALEDGRLQAFDESGKLTRSGDAAAAVTTGPLFVRTPRGQLVLVGTRNSLTALNAEDLRPLGRVTLKDSPRGSLFAQDLDNDGMPEVVLFTESSRVVVVKSDEGKVIWEADAKRADAASFADLNGDHVLDLLITGREGPAFALSGRDGAIIWKDESSAQIVTNHAPATIQRSSLVVSSPAGVLFIATDPARGGLRALEFPQAVAPRN
jgi:outer membrane protein assembly factor BamB